jgi:hypothetical protein
MIGHIIYNYQHLDDVRIQQELSKKLYTKVFGGVHLVHAYNGKKEFGYEPYLEDKFIRIKNRGHYKGAVDLINAGIKYLQGAKIKGLKYVLVTAADTWAIDTRFLKKVMKEMELEGKVLAASSWGNAVAPARPTGFSTDFFLFDLEWNHKAKLWPLDYDGFIEKFEDVLAINYTQPTVELAAQYAFQKHFLKTYEDNDVWRTREKMFRRLIEREPIHIDGERISDWPNLGLYTSPDPKTKQAILKKKKLDVGRYTGKLIKAKNLEYYNKI